MCKLTLAPTHEPNHTQAKKQIEQNIQTSIEVKATLEELKGFHAKCREGAVTTA
jgi:hypothetical protein